MRKDDDNILVVTSREVFPAEAHYHPSCYKDYTRTPKTAKREVDDMENVNAQYQERTATVHFHL